MIGRRRKKGGKDSRLFFATDVHGSDRCFRKFLNAAKVYEAQTLVIGGDVTGKRLLPIVARGDGTHTAHWAGREQTLDSAGAVDEFRTTAANAGLYGFETTPEEVAAMDADPALVERRFLELAQERLREWVALAAERLDGADVNLVINCGNDDPFELDAILEDAESVTFAEGRVVPIDERRAMVSVGYANITPWHCVRDIDEHDLEARIAAATDAWQESGREHLVLNLHPPPYDTPIDQAPMLDDDLRPVTEGGQMVITAVGSKAVRRAIETYQPILSLHGHIHESRGVAQIGPTICINPGSEYPDGVLRGAIVDFDADGVKGYVLTSS
jgi:Icc-related predicted phosphoesterase